MAAKKDVKTVPAQEVVTVPAELNAACKATLSAVRDTLKEADKTGVKRQTAAHAVEPIISHESVRGLNDFNKRRDKVIALVLHDVPRITGATAKLSETDIRQKKERERLMQELRQAVALAEVMRAVNGKWNGEKGLYMVPLAGITPPDMKGATLPPFAKKRLILGSNVLLDNTTYAFDDEDGDRKLVTASVATMMQRAAKSAKKRGTKKKTASKTDGATNMQEAPLSTVLLFVDNKLAGLKASEMDDKVRDAAARALRTLISVFGEQGAIKLYRDYKSGPDAAKQPA